MPKVTVERFPTGSTPIDRLLRGGLPSCGVTLVYGEAGTGKTTLALQSAVAAGERGNTTFFIDADETFSAERLMQMTAGDPEEVAQLIGIFSPRSFYEQTILVESLNRLIARRRGLLVIDSINRLYRLAITSLEQATALSKELNRQLAYITQTVMDHHMPALLTSHVRSILSDDLLVERIEPVAARTLQYWTTDIIHLKTGAAPSVKLAFLEKYGGRKLPRPPFCHVRVSEGGLEAV
jgi:RecA/RadA recombinase